MRIAASVLFSALLLAAQDSRQPSDWQGWLNRGVQAFKNRRVDEAIAAFQRACDLNPNNVTPHLYLATAYMQKVIPGATSPENSQAASRAEAEFEQVLTIAPDNKLALNSLGSMALFQKKWDDAENWYNRLLSLDQNDKGAWYTLGFIAWSKWYPAYGAARAKLNLRPEAPGPMPDGAVKTELANQYTAVIEEGIEHLKRALEIDPKYDDAMAYMNLLVRERADLRSTAAEYRQDVAEADGWVQKVLAIRKERAQTDQGGMGYVGPPPPPPPPADVAAQAGAPIRIKIDGNTEAMKLINQVRPVYPPLAEQARISGLVRLNVVIAKDGTVQNVRVISGHPLLVSAVVDAVKQWVYRTTLLNGEPVEVETTVEVTMP